MLLKCTYRFHELIYLALTKFSILSRSVVPPKGGGGGGDMPHPGSAIDYPDLSPFYS